MLSLNRVLLAMLSASLLPVSASADYVRDHQDFRTSAKLVLPVQDGKSRLAVNDAIAVRTWLQQHAKMFDLPTTLDNLELAKVRHSLSASHYHYQQYLNGLKVLNGEVIISVSKQDNRVLRAFNNSYPVSATVVKSKGATVTAEQALATAWQQIAADNLTEAPRSEMVYVSVGGQLVLAHRTLLSTGGNKGAWEHWVDAETGAVIRALRKDLPNKQAPEKISKRMQQSANFKTAPVSLKAATAAWTASQQKSMLRQSQLLTTATAKVFDPDPRTALNTANLLDTSSAASFTLAYKDVTLQDVTLNAGVYSLTGPWVTIANISTPNTAPSTSATGAWTAARGANAFNDANVYFHLDQNQRYIQSLGFVNGASTSGIQQGSIRADTDALDGADQSQFNPNSNTLEFGHGCVDDAEDADVILHEYGHGLQHDINPNWDGGDTGAMGEGFGDYWAASYSYSTLPNGAIFDINRVFTWDGHGAGVPCADGQTGWAGRRLNRTDDKYDSRYSYGAHQTVAGVLGDELWSTPLFQSLVDLIGLGQTRASLDRIILESHFGLGTGMTMPEMAESTLLAAMNLEPAGPHGDTLLSRFEQVNILKRLSIGDYSSSDTDGDGAAEPGETVTFTIPLRSVDVRTLSNIEAELSTSTAGIAIPASTSTYNDLTFGSTGNNNTPFSMQIPSGHVCGDPIALDLAVSFTSNGPKTSNFTLSVPTGTRDVNSVSAAPALLIPDNSATGVQTTLSFAGTNKTVTEHFNIDLNISHSYRGDLEIRLRSPSGTLVTLTSPNDDSSADWIGNFPADFTPIQSLSAFVGEPLDGVWTLTISDAAPADVGTLNSWKLNAPGTIRCNGVARNELPVATVASPLLSINEGTVATLDASNSADPDGDALSYQWTQTAGTTVTLSAASSAVATFTAPDVAAITDLQFLVTVNDGNGGSDTETVTVRVNPVASSGGGGGGGGGGTSLLALPLFAWLVRRRQLANRR